MYHLSPCIVALPNKRVQSDAAAAAGYRGENWLRNVLRIEADFGKVAARQWKEKSKLMIANNTSEQEGFLFPVGYHIFHKNKDINFQLNRFYSFGYWTKADAEEAGNAIKGIKDWKPTFTTLAERHMAANRPLAAAFSYRAAEFYVLPGKTDKIRLYDAIQVDNLEKFSIPYIALKVVFS